MGILNRLVNYIKETRVEVGRVNWPSRNATINFTLIVIGISAVIAVFLGGLDILFGFFVRLLI